MEGDQQGYGYRETRRERRTSQTVKGLRSEMAGMRGGGEGWFRCCSRTSWVGWAGLGRVGLACVVSVCVALWCVMPGAVWSLPVHAGAGQMRGHRWTAARWMRVGGWWCIRRECEEEPLFYQGLRG